MENVYATKRENRIQITKWTLFVIGFIILCVAIFIIGLIIASGDKFFSVVNTDQSAISWLLNCLS